MLCSLFFRFQAIYFIYDPLFANSPLCAKGAFEITLAFAAMYEETKNAWAKALLESTWSYTGSYVATRVLTAWTKNLDEVGRPAANYPDERVPRELMFPVRFLPRHHRDSLDVLVHVTEQLQRVASDMHLRPNDESHALPDLRFGVLGGRCISRQYVFPPRSIIILWRAHLSAQDFARRRAAAALPSNNHGASGSGDNHAEGHSDQDAEGRGDQNAEASRDRVAEGSRGRDTKEPGSPVAQTPEPRDQQITHSAAAVSPSVEARRKRVNARMVVPPSKRLLQLMESQQAAAASAKATTSAAVGPIKTEETSE